VVAGRCKEMGVERLVRVVENLEINNLVMGFYQRSVLVIV
jgi:hypothetical protein